MTFSGQDVPPIKMRIIFKAMESNTSLRELVINRKGMTDEEGTDLAKCLEYNRTLERLSLEGNLLGTNFLTSLYKPLMVNTTLRYLDLEGNRLTGGTEAKSKNEDRFDLRLPGRAAPKEDKDSEPKGISALCRVNIF
jgi:Leucine Rich repeat